MSSRVAHTRKLIEQYELKLDQFNAAYEALADDANDLIEIGRNAYFYKQKYAYKYCGAADRVSIYKLDVSEIPEEKLIKYAKSHLKMRRKQMTLRIANLKRKMAVTREKLHNLETELPKEPMPPAPRKIVCPSCRCKFYAEQQPH